MITLINYINICLKAHKKDHNLMGADFMAIYFFIFISKIIENTLATLRLILVANGKKILGAILQFFIALVWIYTAGAVLNNVKEDFFKVIIFAIGSLVGSYVGSVIEEKIALGNNLLIVVSSLESSPKIIKELRDNNITVNVLNNKNKNIFIVVVPRKKRENIMKTIKKYDRKARVIASNAKTIFDSYKDINNL